MPGQVNYYRGLSGHRHGNCIVISVTRYYAAIARLKL